MKGYMPVVRYIIYKASDRKHAVTGQTIGDAFGISSSKVRSYVNEARCDGVPICSCGVGYYYSIKRGDLDETIRHLKSRVTAVENAIDGLNSVTPV